MKKLLFVALCATVASVFAGAGLPKEYQEVEWIASDGTQWIRHSGYVRSAKTTRMKMMWYMENYGRFDGQGSYRVPFGEEPAKGKFYLRYGGNNTLSYVDESGSASVSIAAGQNGTNIVTVAFDVDPKVLVLSRGDSGTSSWTKNPTLTNFSSYDVGIFCNNQNDQGKTDRLWPIAIRFYELKYWEKDGEEDEYLAANFVPCYRRSDGVVGLYETVSERFIANQNASATVDFAKGPNVVNANTITVFSDRDDVPASAVLTPALGQSTLTPGVATTAKVEPASVLSEDGAFRHTVTGYEHCVITVAGMAIVSNSGATCSFTPAEGDEVLHTWLWQTTKASTRLFVANDRDDIPAAAGLVPAVGETVLTPNVVVTARVTDGSVISEGKMYRYTLTGWECIVTNKFGGATTNTGSNAVCAFIPLEGDDVYLTWKWTKSDACTSSFRILDAAGTVLAGTYDDLATAIGAATNDCTVELCADSYLTNTITIVDKHVTLKSKDGERYTLYRYSGDAGFIIDAEDAERRLPDSLYKDYTDESYGVEGHSGSYGYETTRLCVTNLVIDGGLLDGIQGSGAFIKLEKGVQCSTSFSKGYSCYNFSGFKLQDGAEICNVATVDAYMINYADQFTVVRLYKGSKIHDVKGQKGVLSFPTAGSIFNFNLRMIGSEIYNCRSETTPILWIGPRRLDWNKVRFVDCTITNNLVASDASGAVYCSSSDTSAYYAFSIGGNVRITDNFLLDGTTPANVRINNNTSMDIHKKLGPNAKIGLAYTTGSAKVEAETGDQIGIVTPKTDKGSARAISYDGDSDFVGKIKDQTVVWHEIKGLLLLVK